MTFIKFIIFAVIFVFSGYEFIHTFGSGKRLYEEEKGAKNSDQTVRMTRISDVKVSHEQDPDHKDDDDYTQLIDVYKAKYEYNYNGKSFTVKMRSYNMLSPYETMHVNPSTGRVIPLIQQENANKLMITLISMFACIASGLVCITLISYLFS